MAELSKTARASMQAGEGLVKRAPVAWGYLRRTNGGMHLKPDYTFYVLEEAKAWEERVGGDGYLVTSEGLGKNTVRR